jgi:hypothetical protein
MARHHIRLKEHQWREGLFINATGAALSLVVDVIIAITKFKPKGAILGAWVIVVFVPVMVWALTRPQGVRGRGSRTRPRRHGGDEGPDPAAPCRGDPRRCARSPSSTVQDHRGGV